MPTFKIVWTKTYYRSGVEEVEAANADEARAFAEDHIGDWEGSMQYDADADMIDVFPESQEANNGLPSKR